MVLSEFQFECLTFLFKPETQSEIQGVQKHAYGKIHKKLCKPNLQNFLQLRLYPFMQIILFSSYLLCGCGGPRV